MICSRGHFLRKVLGITALVLLMQVGIAGAMPFAYIPNSGDNTVSVIDLATNNVTATVSGLNGPMGVAVNPEGTKVYVTNFGNGGVSNNTVSVIDTETNNVTATVPVGNYPCGVAITPDGTKVYVANEQDGTVSVINTATGTVTSTVPVGFIPKGVAVTPDGTKVYVTNWNDGTVSVISTTNNTAYASVTVGSEPIGVAISPNNARVYVANCDSNNVSIIDTTNNTVIDTVPVGTEPVGVAVSSDGTKVYVTNTGDSNAPAELGNVSVISTTNNTAYANVTVGSSPGGLAITSDGSHVYVANWGDTPGDVSVIDTVTNTVTATVKVGSYPTAIGRFISNIPPTPAKTTPTIIWSNPTDITYGTALSSTQLDAIARSFVRGIVIRIVSVPGTFVYSPPAGTKLSVGSHQALTAHFTPTDTENYNSASANVSINVLNTARKTPIIAWNNPANITYGTTLSSAQLDATASELMVFKGHWWFVSVPGTFVYTPPAGTKLNVGAHKLDVSFTPTDIANYTTASASVSINVTKETPIIVWNNPANITSGTALSNTQLDAAAISFVGGSIFHFVSVPGTFVYTPPAGTKLNVGAHKLNVSFTPTDIINYTTASASVSINVRPHFLPIEQLKTAKKQGVV
jgi:YVTN family beta-propeller protein